MQILVVQTKHYDGCAATLIEGLNFLSMQKVLSFNCTENSNYAYSGELDFSIRDEDIKHFADDADIIIIISFTGTNCGDN